MKGDVNDKEYQRQVIDNLVSQVYITDTDTVVYLNIKGGKNIETCDLDDTKEVLTQAQSVRMRLPPARQLEPKSNIPIRVLLLLSI